MAPVYPSIRFFLFSATRAYAAWFAVYRLLPFYLVLLPTMHMPLPSLLWCVSLILVLLVIVRSRNLPAWRAFYASRTARNYTTHIRLPAALPPAILPGSVAGRHTPPTRWNTGTTVVWC